MQISAIGAFIFALTVEGTLYSCRRIDVVVEVSKPVWTVVLENLKIDDIATSGSDDVVVVELRNNIRLVLSYRDGIFHPRVLLSSPNVTSLDECFAEISQATYRTISAESGLKKLRTLANDIGSLWESKVDINLPKCAGDRFVDVVLKNFLSIYRNIRTWNFPCKGKSSRHAKPLLTVEVNISQKCWTTSGKRLFGECFW